MENILITGGAGYIGSILSLQLLELGFNVTVIDNFSTGEPYLSHACRFKNFTPIKGDVRDRNVMDKLIASHDSIIPLAAKVGAPLCKADEVGAVTINRDAILYMVSKMSSSQKVIFPCTNSGYGIGISGQFCTEETPLNPISLYGTTKVEAEKAVLDSGFGITLRLATVFGMSPCMRTDLLVNDFTYRAHSDSSAIIFEGHFKRNYIHVRDVSKAFIHSLSHFDKMKNNAYNLGLSSANLSKIELCQKIKEHYPKFIYLEAPIGEDPDKRDYIVSNEKIEKTGWSPDWSLDMGIEELKKGYIMLKDKRFTVL